MQIRDDSTELDLDCTSFLDSDHRHHNHGQYARHSKNKHIMNVTDAEKKTNDLFPESQKRGLGKNSQAPLQNGLEHCWLASHSHSAKQLVSRNEIV